MNEDLKVVLAKDPAAKSPLTVRLYFGGYIAVRRHRRANWFYRHNMRFIARMIAGGTRKKTGVDIHPAARIGKGFFIDHGVGVVIGETTEIGDYVTVYQGVTLGGTGKDVGKRHPTIGDGVMISAGAKVLGPITVGSFSKIGAGSVVLKNVPPHCTVVGVPGRVVRQAGVKVNDMDQVKLPDPILDEIRRLNERIQTLEQKLDVHACRYSIVYSEDQIGKDE